MKGTIIEKLICGIIFQYTNSRILIVCIILLLLTFRNPIIATETAAQHM